MVYTYTIQQTKGNKMYTGRKTSVIKIAEFEEIAETLRSMTADEKQPLLGLIERQTQAKQDKFWRFYDSRG
jgi:hypothetical protein